MLTFIAATLMLLTASKPGVQATVIDAATFVVSLASPEYPPFALAARIEGTVVVTITFRADGTVDSATTSQAGTVLGDAALKSARASTFACADCSAVAHALTYRYALTSSMCGDSFVQRPVPVTLSKHEVIIVGEIPMVCDPAVPIERMRALRCLFFWRCGLQRIELVTPDAVRVYDWNDVPRFPCDVLRRVTASTSWPEPFSSPEPDAIARLQRIASRVGGNAIQITGGVRNWSFQSSYLRVRVDILRCRTGF